MMKAALFFFNVSKAIPYRFKRIISVNSLLSKCAIANIIRNSRFGNALKTMQTNHCNCVWRHLDFDTVQYYLS